MCLHGDTKEILRYRVLRVKILEDQIFMRYAEVQMIDIEIDNLFEYIQSYCKDFKIDY